MTKASTDNQPGSSARVTSAPPHPQGLLARNLDLAWRVHELEEQLDARTKELAALAKRSTKQKASAPSRWWIVAAFLLGLALILTVLIACEVVRRG